MYSKLPARSFWRNCREASNFLANQMYQPKFALKPGMKVATAGSCFAQNIGRYIRHSQLELIDTEPAPKLMPSNVAKKYGFGLYSARYGNVYTPRQLKQLLNDCVTQNVRETALWQQNDRWFDGLRPNVEPTGLDNQFLLAEMRQDHLLRVSRIFDQADVFIFTLGLTEAWRDKRCGTVFPTAPGTIAGSFKSDVHEFVNFGIADCLEDMAAAISQMKELAPSVKVLLTVSPVPLTATATGTHALTATTYSKSVLRVVAEELVRSHQDVDYFPSYELITGSPFASQFYSDNLRNVTAAGVEFAMQTFFSAHSGISPVSLTDFPKSAFEQHQAAIGEASEYSPEICEEALLEAFAPQ